MPRTNDFSLAEALQAFMDDSGVGDRQRWQRVQNTWPEVVGAAIARETLHVSFAEGICTLQIRTATWRHQLLMQKTELMHRLNEALGKPLIQELRIV